MCNWSAGRRGGLPAKLIIHSVFSDAEIGWQTICNWSAGRHGGLPAKLIIHSVFLMWKSSGRE